MNDRGIDRTQPQPKRNGGGCRLTPIQATTAAPAVATRYVLLPNVPPGYATCAPPTAAATTSQKATRDGQRSRRIGRSGAPFGATCTGGQAIITPHSVG